MVWSRVQEEREKQEGIFHMLKEKKKLSEGAGCLLSVGG